MRGRRFTTTRVRSLSFRGCRPGLPGELRASDPALQPVRPGTALPGTLTGPGRSCVNGVVDNGGSVLGGITWLPGAGRQLAAAKCRPSRRWRSSGPGVAFAALFIAGFTSAVHKT
jgi:hypothetical protein